MHTKILPRHNNRGFFNLNFLIALCISCKTIVLFLFSSEINHIFLNFTNLLSIEITNPWDFYLQNNKGLDSFPYHPLMLYILYPFAKLSAEFNLVGFFKIPLFLADLSILICLFKILANHKREVFLYYFCNPIVFYGTYIHSQLDIIPTAILLWSIFFLTCRKYSLSATLLGCALATKSHIALCVPLLMIYLAKNVDKKNALYFFLITTSVLLFFDAPFIISDGFHQMVLFNPKQSSFFDYSYSFFAYNMNGGGGSIIFLLPISAVVAIYIHLCSQKRINNDLLYLYIGLLFSSIILLSFPSPAWYIWLTPFVSIYFAVYSRQHKSMAFSLHTLLSLSYLVFFVFFYNDKYADILFFNQIIDAKNYNVNLRNLSFTILETSLFIIIYAFYKYGITSNSKYPNHTNLVIGIGGDSGVGKTTLLKGLTNIFHDQLLELEGDGEHKWERGDKHWDNFTHLDPKANHIHQQTKIICDLKNDKKIYRRNYDHSSGKISDPILIEPKKIIVIAGLHPFYLPKLRANIDLKIFLDTDEKLKKHWKILRDVKHRGYTKEKVLEQIETRLGDAQKYIYPQKDFADIIINFFPNQNFEIGNPQDKPSLGLRIIFDANIHIEDILEYLDCEFMWDYNQDLKSQFVELKNAPQINISDIAHKVIDNLQDLIPPSANWEKGYFGLIQIILLRMISEKMKDKEYQ